MAAISTAFVKQFGANIMHLVQQKGSRLRNAVIVESGIVGEEALFDQLGTFTAQKKTTRNSDTPIQKANHQRRMVVMHDYEIGDLVDNEDRLKMLLDPTSRYLESQAFALGRQMDQSIIDAATGTAFTDKTGSTSTTLPSGQKVAAAATGLTLAKLLSAKEILNTNNVDLDEERILVVTETQVKDLMNITEVKNIDFNTQRVLASGRLESFLGFRIIQTELLNTDSNSDRQVLAFAKSGLLLAIAKDVKTRVAERADKSFSTQVYASLGIGATRMEEEKMVEIACVE